MAEGAIDTNTTATETTGTAPAASPAKTWIDSLTPEHKGLVESKGFKEPAELIQSYANLEKLKGVPEQFLLRLPEKSDDKDGWNTLYSKLGRPQKPEEYQIEVPEGMQVDEGTQKWVRETFHGLGLSKSQGENFIKQWNQLGLAKQKEMTEAQQHQLGEAEKELKTKWGMAFDKNNQIAENAAKQFGVDKDMYQGLMSVLGPSKTKLFFHHLGEAVGEANFIGKDSSRKDLKSPEAAQYELKQLQNDEGFMKKFMEGDIDSVNKFNRLIAMSHPDLAG